MSGPEGTMELGCEDVREMAGAYVLGALDPGDAAAVRAHLAGCPDAHAEIEELGGVVPALAQGIPLVDPPAGLKSRILAAAAADLTARGSDAGPVQATADSLPAADPLPAAAGPDPAPAAVQGAAAPKVPTGRPRMVPLRSSPAARPSAGTWALRIAAVVAIVALGGWGLTLNAELEAARAFDRNVAAVLDAASAPGALRAILVAEGGSGSGLAAVTSDGSVALAMRDLPPTDGQTVYEAWAIGADGVPVAIGTFRVDRTGIGFLQAAGVPNASGIVLALTHEPGPGLTAPTGPIVAKGIATGAG